MNLKIPLPHPTKDLSFLFPALVAAADASPAHLADVRTLARCGELLLLAEEDFH